MKSHQRSFHKTQVFLIHLLVASAFLTRGPAAYALQGPNTITLDGRLYNTPALDTPLIDPNVVLLVQVLDEDKNCILYEERQSVDTTASNGYFNIQVGSDPGSTKRQTDDSGNTMTEVFQNVKSVAAKGVSCGGVTYGPVAGKKRVLRVFMSPSLTGTTEMLQPDLALDAVPTALVAETVQGLDRAHILEIGTTPELTQANVQTIFSSPNFTNLTALLGGSSSQYVRSSTNGAVLPAPMTTPTSPVAGQIWFDTSTGKLQYSSGGGTIHTLESSSSGGITSSQIADGAITGPKLAPNLSYTTSGTLNASTLGARSLQIYESGTGANSVTLQAPSPLASYVLTLPNAQGGAGTVLTNNGSGALTWTLLGTGGGSTTFPLLASPTGTAAAPAYSFASDATTGIYSNSAGRLGFATVGVERFVVNSNGVIDFRAVDSVNEGGEFVINGAGANNNWTVDAQAQNLRFTTSSNATNFLQIRNYGSGVSDLAVQGSVAVDLDGQNAGNGTRSLRFGALYSGEYIASKRTAGGNQYGLDLGTNGTARVSVDILGKVGIGTTAPVAILDIAATGTQSAMILPRDTTAARPTGVNGMLRYNVTTQAVEAFANNAWASLSGGGGASAGVSGAMQFSNGSSGFSADATNLFWDNSTKRLGIGTNTPAASLQVASSDTTSTTGDRSSLLSSIMINPSASQAAGASRHAIQGRAEFALGASNAAQTYSGVSGEAYNFNTGAAATAVSGLAAWAEVGTGTTTSAVRGAYIGSQVDAGTVGDLFGSQVESYVAGGTITNQVGLNLWLSKTGGTVANRYGLRISAPTGTTTTSDYAIYSAGSQSSYLGGNLGIGTTAPAALLDVAGRLKVNSTGQLGIGADPVATYDILVSRANEAGQIRIENTSSSATPKYPELVIRNHAGSVGGAPTLEFQTTRGTSVAPVATAGGDLLGQLLFVGYGNTYSDAARISGYAEVTSATNIIPGYLAFSTTSIGATGATEKMRLSANGALSLGGSAPTAGTVADFNGTGTTQSSILLPRANTASRPTGVNGMVRYNTTLQAVEAFANNAWVNLSAGTGSASGVAGAVQFSNGSSAFNSDATNLFWNNTTKRLGIGSASPQASLEVVGTMVLRNPSGDDLLAFNTNGAVGQIVSGPKNGIVLANASTEPVNLITHGAAPVQVFTTDIERMRVTPTGLVGIGSTNPQTNLDIYGTAANGFVSASVTNGDGTNGTAAFYITNYGSGGTPLLQFNGYGGNQATPTATRAGGDLGDIQMQGFLATQAGGGVLIRSQAEQTFTDSSAPSSLEILTTPTGSVGLVPRMTITGDGGIGFGPARPSAGAVADFNATGTGLSTIILPRGTTAERPTTPINGMTRYNSTLSKFEVYEGGAWSNMISAGRVLIVVDQKASGVDGGTCIAGGGGNVRTLNTVRTNTIPNASLGTNQSLCQRELT